MKPAVRNHMGNTAINVGKSVELMTEARRAAYNDASSNGGLTTNATGAALHGSPSNEYHLFPS